MNGLRETGVWEPSYRSVGHQHGIRKGAGQFGHTVLKQSRLVENATGEDRVHGIRCAVSHEELRRHERKRPRIPAVAVIDPNHGEEADADSNCLVDLQLERQGGLE